MYWYIGTAVCIALFSGNQLLEKLPNKTQRYKQGGVLSPYLFSLYIDDVIIALRNSGYGICVRNAFTGRMLHADDIILL